MAFVLGVAAAAGFFSSMALLHFGMTRMAIRYPLALVLAYLVFLVLIRFLADAGIGIPAAGPGAMEN